MSTGLARFRHIAVEGPIGAGKTSLARRLAEHLGAQLVLEQPDANPFLARFYQDPARHALPTQLFFLFQRAGQLSALAQEDLFGGPVVSDFMLEKDTIFARLTLDDEEYALYRQIHNHLDMRVPEPDLVIYLQAPVEVLADRVQRRGRDYERGVPDDYLARLADAYGAFFLRYDEAPVMMVNTSNLNFVDGAEDFDLLLRRLEAMRGPREFFNKAD